MSFALHVPSPDLYVEDVRPLVGVRQVFQHNELIGLVSGFVPGRQVAQPFSFMVVTNYEVWGSGETLFVVVGGEKGAETLEGVRSLWMLYSEIEVLFVLVETLEKARGVGGEELGLFA